MYSSRVSRYAVVAAFLIPLLFALGTDHLWEDFFITFRSSQNLVHGHGLVFQPGERVQTFTSPLGTLVPALCSWLSGGHNDPAAIWIFRLVCCGFLAATMAWLLRVLRLLELGAAGCLTAVGLFLLDAKISDFTIDGMETAILLFFAVWTVLALLQSPQCSVQRLAIGFAGLMWTRPDGFVFAGGLVIGFVVFVWSGEHAEARWPVIAKVIRGTLVGIVLYLPWAIWAWRYYGTLVPNTITAKAAVLAPGWHGLLDFPAQLLAGSAWLAKIFMPSYFILGGWSGKLFGFSALLTIPAALYWVWPKGRPAVRALSLGLFLGGAYLQCIPQFPWYYPWWQLLAIVIDAAIVADALRFADAFAVDRPGPASRFRIAVKIVVGAVLLVQAGIWGCTAVEMRRNQAIIEYGSRRPIGIWLHDHARPGDTVMLEPLGYIGYYSGLKMLDYPGLSAPEVTRAIKQGAKGWAALASAFQPDWLVLRPSEAQQVVGNNPAEFWKDYRSVAEVNARDRIAGYAFYPGRGLALTDSDFVIYHRVTPKTTAGARAPVSRR